MNHAAASSIAEAISGACSPQSPVHQTFAATLARSDGRNLYLEEDAGACHAGDAGFVVSLHIVSDAYRHTCESYE